MGSHSEFRRPSNQIEASTNCSKIAAAGPDRASISSRSTCQRFGFLALNKAAMEQSWVNLPPKSLKQIRLTIYPTKTHHLRDTYHHLLVVQSENSPEVQGPLVFGFFIEQLGRGMGPTVYPSQRMFHTMDRTVGTLRPLADIGGRLLEERLQNNWRRSSSEAWWKKTAPVQLLIMLIFWFSYEVFIIHPVFPAAWVMQLCSQEVSQFVTHLQMKPTMKFSPGVLIFLIEQFVLGIWKALLDMFARRNGFGKTSGNLGGNLRWFFAVKATATDADRLDVYWWVILAAEIQWWERWW